MTVNDEFVCLYNQAGTIRLKPNMPLAARKQIIKMYLGDVKDRHFVKSAFDFISTDPRLLSFKKGDIIEVVPAPMDVANVTGLSYGKMDARSGFFSTDYVVEVDENMEEVQRSCN